MFRSVLRAAVAAATASPATQSLNPACISGGIISADQISSRFYSAKASKSSLSKVKKKSQSPSKSEEFSGGSAADVDADLDGERIRMQKLAEDEKNKALDVGANGRPLFTSASSLSELSRKDCCSYMKFSMDDLNAALPEGLPAGMLKEFEDTKRSALLVRQSFLDLRDNFRRIVDPPVWSSNAKAPKVRKQIVLDGPRSCGKSIAVSMLVHWARDEGWLVFYVPEGSKWTHGGFFYKNPQTDLWDTPKQAEDILKEFSLFNETRLKQLPCQTYNEPIPLGEGVGVGWFKGADSMAMPEGSTLYDLVMAGVNNTHAAVGVLVRLRKELSLVKDIPVLIAIDQYNSWFTFSEYQEPVTVRSCKPIHARDLSTVNAFRSMMHEDMMVGAFSHSTAVGKLRQELPSVPVDARVNFPRAPSSAPAAAKTSALPTITLQRSEPPKNLRGLNKPKCIKCGNVARSRCPFQSCKSCCSKAQNPCHIHVLRPNATLADRSPSNTSHSDQPPIEVSPSGPASRPASIRQLSSTFAQFNNVHIPLRSRKPLTRKDAITINEWRFSKLKEFRDGNIEAENEAFDRYMQNISLLEEVFDLEATTPMDSDSSVLDKTKMLSGMKAILRSDPIRSDKFRKRIQNVVQQGLVKLTKQSEKDSSEDINDSMEHDPTPKKAKIPGDEKASLLSQLNDKINKARNEDDLNLCLQMMSQLTSYPKRAPESTENSEVPITEHGFPAGQAPDYSLQKLVKTHVISQEELDKIDMNFSSLEEIEDL